MAGFGLGFGFGFVGTDDDDEPDGDDGVDKDAPAIVERDVSAELDVEDADDGPVPDVPVADGSATVIEDPGVALLVPLGPAPSVDEECSPDRGAEAGADATAELPDPAEVSEFAEPLSTSPLHPARARAAASAIPIALGLNRRRTLVSAMCPHVLSRRGSRQRRPDFAIDHLRSKPTRRIGPTTYRYAWKAIRLPRS